MKVLLAFYICIQVVFGVPAYNPIKDAVKVGVEVVSLGGRVVATGFETAGTGVELLTNTTEEGIKTLNNVTFEVSDVLLELLDNKIEFILCRIFRVCKNLRGRFDLFEEQKTIEELNNSILELASDEPAKGRLLWLFNKDYQTYISQKIQEILCKYGSDHLCTEAEDTIAEDTMAEDTMAEDTMAEDTIAEDTIAEDTIVEDVIAGAGGVIAGAGDVIAGAGDVIAGNGARFLLEAPVKGKATPTVSLAVRKVFSHLTVKVGFAACKLRVWCPDESLQFTPEEATEK